MPFYRSLEGPEIMTGFAAIPAAATDLVPTGKKCKVFSIVISNPTAGSITVTLRNASGSAVYAVIPVATNTSYTWPPNGSEDFGGVIFTNGLEWQASGAGLYGEVIGTKQL